MFSKGYVTKYVTAHPGFMITLMCVQVSIRDAARAVAVDGAATIDSLFRRERSNGISHWKYSIIGYTFARYFAISRLPLISHQPSNPPSLSETASSEGAAFGYVQSGIGRSIRPSSTR